jgi:predicted membrane-bound spermidine synthase
LFLWPVAFWAGAAVMAFELAGARLLMPAFGMGIEVWAVVIATSLGALAIGYGLGGKIIDARPGPVMPAVALLLACVSLLLLRIFASRITGAFAGMSLVVGACCSAVAILGVPMLFLGMVPPMLARLLLGTTAQTGTVVGGLMAVGTAGSVFGTVLTGLVLIPRLGVSKTIVILAVGTAAFSLLVLAGRGRLKATAVVTIIAVALIGGRMLIKSEPHRAGPMRLLESAEGAYGHLEVLEHHGTRALVCNGIFQTVMPSSGLGITKGTLIRGRDYIELIPYFRPGCRDALMIGVAGALHEQGLALYGIEVQGVEIEPAVIPLAVRYFGLAADVIVADGRRFLAHNEGRFDAIILDAFVGGAVPEHLFTREAFELMGERLNEGGLLVVHVIGKPGHVSTRAIARTVESVFPHTAAIRSGFGEELQHVYLFGSDKELELGRNERSELQDYGFTGQEFCRIESEGAALLTDDKSGLILVSSDIMAEHRKHSLGLRRKPLW